MGRIALGKWKKRECEEKRMKTVQFVILNSSLPEPTKTANLSRPHWSFLIYVFPETIRVGAWERVPQHYYHGVFYRRCSCFLNTQSCLPLKSTFHFKKKKKRWEEIATPICCLRCELLWCTGYECHMNYNDNNMKSNEEIVLTMDIFNK